MDRPDIPVVSVFGANDPAEGDEAYQQARAAGRELARLGYAVANGGYAGTMEASFRGAKEAGGATIGVICTLWKSPANRYTDRVIKTRDLFERARTLVELGSAGYVVLPGATGTLVELALVWELTCKRLMARRPIVCLAFLGRVDCGDVAGPARVRARHRRGRFAGGTGPAFRGKRGLLRSGNYQGRKDREDPKDSSHAG